MTEFGSKVEPLANIKDHHVVRAIFGSHEPEVMDAPRGTVIYERDNYATPLLVVSGRLARQTSSPYVEMPFTHSLAGPGDILIEGLPDQASLVRTVAERDSSFIPLPFDDLEALVYQNTEGGRLIFAQLLNTRRQGTELAHMARFGLNAPTNKAASALIKYGPFAKRIQTPDKEVWDISSAATQSEIAQAAGMDRHSLNNVALGKLESKRVIERPLNKNRTRRIQVVDVALLEQLADPTRI